MRLNEVAGEIKSACVELLKSGLVVEADFPKELQLRTIRVLTWPSYEAGSLTLGDHPYKEVYEEYSESRNYLMRIYDGAILQIHYEFDRSGRHIRRHRLAYLPSPGPVVSLTGQSTAFSVRFDFDSDDARHVAVDHPKSHLTLGDSADCRIPVVGPVAPKVFLDFIFRNLYHRKLNEHGLSLIGGRFAESIAADERKVLHISLA